MFSMTDGSFEYFGFIFRLQLKFQRELSLVVKGLSH